MPYTIYEKAGSDAAVAAALAALPPGGDSLPANAAGVLTNDGSGVLSWEAIPAGTYLFPDQTHPGLYLPPAGSAMVEDPTHDGLYTIGPLA